MREAEEELRGRKKRRRRDAAATTPERQPAADPAQALAAVPQRAALQRPCGDRKLGLAAAPFLSRSGCESIVALCEAHAASAEGWSKELAVRYPQTTTDLEVDRVPALRRWMTAAGLMPAARDHYRAAHGAPLYALDDLFVIKYDATGGGAQKELIPHRDAGDLSFMVALSERADYAGGGTHFTALGECADGEGDGVVHLEQGELLSFDAALTHSGVPISSGVRYLLVGFCHCRDPTAATEPGNLSCENLEMIPGSAVSDKEEGSGEHAVVPEPVGAVWHRALRSKAIAALQSDALRLATIYDADATDSIAASHWVGATDVARTALEAFALEVLAMHLPTAIGASHAGAEFWVQHLRRGSGPKGSTDEPVERERLPFHFDKDEAALRDGGVWKNPACATVTYLSAATVGDVPTVIFDSVNTDTVTDPSGSSQQGVKGPTQACISYPSEGKHLAFRGKYLHGCPLELASEHCTKVDVDDDPQNSRCDEAAGRLTLLVNVWTQGTKPMELRRLPAEVAAQLSGPPDVKAGRKSVFFMRKGLEPEQLRVVVADSRRRGGVGPAVSLSGHVEGMTKPLPVKAVAAAQEESSCLCLFV